MSSYGLLEYSIDTISDYELEKYKVDLTKYAPDFIRNIETFKAIYDTQGVELGSLNYYLEDLINQCFIDTATWGLIYWEQEYGIETNLYYSYEDRRSFLKARKRGQGTTTIAMIKSVAESFSGGEVDIVEDYENYSFTIQFIGIKGIPKNMEVFKAMIEDIKPAYLGYSFKYTYTIWNVIEKNNQIWSGLKTKTWDEIKISE